MRPNKIVRVIAIIVLIGLLGILATLFKEPILFASIGPTVIIVVHRPDMRYTRPRVIILGHGVAMLAGVGGLLLFGLYGQPSAITAGFDFQRIGATSFAMAVTGVFGEETSFYHPPAGATALLVALGILSSPVQLLSVGTGIVLVALFAALYEYHFSKVKSSKGVVSNR